MISNTLRKKVIETIKNINNQLVQDIHGVKGFCVEAEEAEESDERLRLDTVEVDGKLYYICQKLTKQRKIIPNDVLEEKRKEVKERENIELFPTKDIWNSVLEERMKNREKEKKD